MSRFRITTFRDQRALTKSEFTVDVAELVTLIDGTSAASKIQQPWLKLATFGWRASAKGCLRNDTNVVRVTGTEIDYDAEEVGFEEARQRLRPAGVLAVIYTSASHRPEAPRWRALLPFSKEREPAERRGWALRAGEILGVELHGDSLTLSQAYHYGRITGSPDFQIETVLGEPIDAKFEPVAVGRSRCDLVGEHRECTELTPYGRAALRSAAENILNAPYGEQGRALWNEAFNIGRLAGAGDVPAQLALEILVLAANGIRSHQSKHPWKPGEAEARVRRRFHEGWGRPRLSIEQKEREWARSQAEWAERRDAGETFNVE